MNVLPGWSLSLAIKCLANKQLAKKNGALRPRLVMKIEGPLSGPDEV